MPLPKRKTPAELQIQCDQWNAANPPGTLVSFEEILGDGETFRGRTSSEAQVTGGHTAIVFLEGKRGFVDLEHCTPVAAQEDAGATSTVAVQINVRYITGGYLARAMRRGVTASNSQSAERAAIAVCEKLGLDAALLLQVESNGLAGAFTHPGTPSAAAPA
ncbi:hypothetical protein ACQKO6_17685 [Pseudomonas monteilii]